jgi:hypothetical protein
MSYQPSAPPVWRDAIFWEQNAGRSYAELAREFGASDRVYAKWHKKFSPQKIAQKCKGIVSADLHYPSHDQKLLDNFLRYVDDTKPGIFVFLGDNLDMQPISHWLHDGKKRGSMEGLRLKNDYEGFQRDVLDLLELPDGCRKIWLEGNHEKWVRDYIDLNPEAEGFLEVENNIDLSDWEIYPYGQHATVDDARFIHGAYTNLHCAYKTVQVYGHDVYFGHCHSMQTHTLATPVGDNPIIGTEIPCMCDLNPAYAEDKPNAWVQGFGTFYVADSLQMYITHAKDGVFVAPNGTIYD